MRHIVLSSALALLGACGGTQPEQSGLTMPPATLPVISKVQAVSYTPSTVTVHIAPKIEGIAVYAGYWGPGLPMGDPGYVYQTGITKASGYTFTVPGSAVCGNGFTQAAALDGQTLVATPQGMEMKFIMPNGTVAGTPGATPGDNEVATVTVGGQVLAPLPIMTYTGNGNRNLFVSSWLFGCLP